MPLNWGDAKKAMSERGGGTRNVYRFNIQDGETVKVRFIGGPKEPHMYARHYSKKVNYQICASDAALEGKHQGCVFCYEAKKMGKEGGLSLGQRVFAFSLYDPRKYHKFNEEVEGPNGKNKYQPCKDDPTCKYCRKGNDALVTGVRHWSLAGQTAAQLETFEREVLGKMCAACKTGDIKVTGYVCPTCEDALEVDDPTEELRCFECSNAAKKKGKSALVMVRPQEVVRCSNGCDDAKRITLDDAWVYITRSGERQDTSYNFAPGPVRKDDVPTDISPVDFAHNADFQPRPANEQAAILGVPNPYRAGKLGQVDDPADDEVPFEPARGGRRAATDDTDDEDETDTEDDIFGRKRIK